jgi:hypothetical protein
MCQDLSGKDLPAPSPTGLIAAGKKLCGMCGWKAAGKGDWRCTNMAMSPLEYVCPVADPAEGCGGFLKKPSVTRAPQPKKKGLPVPTGVKFLYFGHRSITRGHHGIVTVAWIIPAPGVLNLGFSFCSPKDPWCKIAGRDMALTRLLHPLVIPFLYSPKRTVREVVMAVLSHDFGRLAALSPGATIWGMIPSWTKGLVNVMKGGSACFISDFQKIGRRLHFISTPRRERKYLTDLIVGYPVPLKEKLRRQGGFIEAAPVSPEAWNQMDVPLEILARMIVDIAKLDGR